MQENSETEQTQESFFAKLIPLFVAIAGMVAGYALLREPREPVDPVENSLPPNARYQLEEARKAALSNPTFVLLHEFAITQEEAKTVATSQDKTVYVGGKESIIAYSFEGEIKHKYPVKGGVTALTLAPDGGIVYATSDSVYMIDKEGKEKTVAEKITSDKSLITSIAANKEFVFVADAGKREIIRIDLEGGKNLIIGRKDERRNIPGLVVPSPYLDIALAPDGLLRVANPGRHKIEAYTPNGDLEWSWGKQDTMAVSGFAGCCNPIHIAIAPSGAVFTAEKGLPRVKIFTPKGDFLCVATDYEKDKLAALDMAVAHNEFLVVLAPDGKKVKIYSYTREPKDDQ
ncbi:MAG: hypothetical protein JXR97_11270 [Planctomycetes bacterium]|nr:hypothetical protein [Planctomycetota bacterium]